MKFIPYYDREISERHRERELKRGVGAPRRPVVKYNMKPNPPTCGSCIKKHGGVPCEDKIRCIHR